MRKTIPITVLFLCFVGVLISGCARHYQSQIIEKDISGDWETIKGDYEYISLDLNTEGRDFSGYLHGRLMNSGTWSMKNGELFIELSNGHKVTYESVSLKQGILDLNNGQERYRRPRTAEQKIRDFLSELVKSQKVDFSGPVSTEFIWNINGEDTTSVKGQMITATVVIENDFSNLASVQKSIGEFLERNDFIMSDFNVSEIVTGYESGFMRVILKSRTDEETEPGSSIFIDVICGIIE